MPTPLLDNPLNQYGQDYNQQMGQGLSAFFHQGDQDFKQPELGRLLDLISKRPAIVAIELDRPAEIPEIAAQCAGLIGTFGCADEAQALRTTLSDGSGAPAEARRAA